MIYGDVIVVIAYILETKILHENFPSNIYTNYADITV